MANYSETQYELRHHIARLIDNRFITGTVSSPGSGTFVCATTPWEWADDYFNDALEVYDYSGTGGGTSGHPTDWVNSTHTLTFAPAATLTADDLVELHWLDYVANYNAAINRAILSVQREALVYTVDESIVLDTLLTNGMFDNDYDTGWTLAGTGATADENTTYFVSGTQSAYVTNQASQAAYLTQSISNYPKYREETFTLKAKVWCATADRVRICLKDGVTTTYSDYHDGGGWDELDVSDFTVDETPTELTVELRTETGTQITAYWDSVTLCGDHIYEYTPSSTFLYIHKIEMESGTEIDDRNIFFHDIPWNGWRILRETTPLIQFHNWTPIAGRRIRVHGLAVQSELATDAATCGIYPEYIVNQAAYYLLRNKGEMFKEQAEDFQKMAAVARISAIRSLPAGSRRVSE